MCAQAALKAQLEELRSQFMRTHQMLKEAQANALARDMANGVDARVKKKIACDGESQTTYTDFDIFDKQDGWFLPISGTASARIKWRRALNFATCPSCRGVGGQVMATAVLLRRLIRGESEKKRPKKGAGVWVLPDEIVQFVCNLPRSVMAHRPYALSWTVNRITHLFMSKIIADEEDVATGYPVQSLEQFIVEKYLMLTEERSEAEIGIHRLLQSVKEHHKRHPLLHIFARFMNILQDPLSVKASDSGDKKRRSTLKKKCSIQQDMFVMDELLKPSSKELPLTVLSIYLFAREEMLKLGYNGAYAAAIAKAKTSDYGDLDKYENLIVSASTKPPKLVNKYINKENDTNTVIRQVKNASITSKRGSVSTGGTVSSATITNTVLDDEELTIDDLCDPVSAVDKGKRWEIKLEPHVCVMSNFTMWIPLDRAIEVVNAVLNFLTDAQLLAVCRRIEHISAFLSPHGQLVSADGNHSEIRQHMRVFLPTALVDGAPGSLIGDGGAALRIAAFVEAQKLLEPSRQYTVVVNLDDALQTIAEMLLTRISHMEERLSKIFYDGDTNGDGVLSYDEFLEIVNKIAPHISKRRVLGMYREVLMMGEDSKKIELSSFITICKKYGLVKLVSETRVCCMLSIYVTHLTHLG